MDGLWRARITAINGATCTLVIPRLSGDRGYRDVPQVASAGAVDSAVGATSAPADDGTVTLRPLEVGDQVIVGFLEGDHTHPIVLGRLAS